MRIRSSRVALALACGACWLGQPGAAAGEAPPPISSTSHHFLIPIGNGRKVVPEASNAPGPVFKFWAEQGKDWSIYWDQRLGTPRFVAPGKPFTIAAPTPMASEPVAELTTSIKEFIDRQQVFLGVSSATLGVPYVYTLLGDWVYVFPQTTHSGMPVRGACLRVVVNETGQLRWIKAFVARDVPEFRGTYLTLDAARERIDPGAAEVLEATFEIGFETDSIGSARPVWSVWIRGANDDESELILDATDGVPLMHRRIIKYYDGHGGGGEGGQPKFTHRGVVVGTYPPRNDFFACPWVSESSEQGMPHVSIRDADRELRPLLVTDPTGGFEATTPFLDAALDADLETTWFKDEDRSATQIMSLRPKRGRTFLTIRNMDYDFDFVPDLLQTYTNPDSLTYRLFDTALMPAPQPGETPVAPEEIAWWLQSFDFAADMLQRASKLLSSSLRPIGMDRPTFLPLSNLVLQPSDAPAEEHHYRRRKSGHGPIDVGLGTLNPDPAIGPTDGKAGIPTILQHEVGHHLFHSITNTTTPGNEAQFSPEDQVVDALEESIGTALTAIHNNDSRIGFAKLASGKVAPTSDKLAVDLSDATPRNIPLNQRIRGEYQTAFWALHRLMSNNQENLFPPRSQSAEALMLLWLGYNRVGYFAQRNFDISHNLAEELLLVSDTRIFGGNGDPADGSVISQDILAAFHDVALFDTVFERGNPNQDGRVDLSDAIYVLGFLFQGGGPYHDCYNAMDADNNGSVELTDAVRILQMLFLGGPPLDPPFPGCGLDPEPPGLPGNAGCREPKCS